MIWCLNPRLSILAEHLIVLVFGRTLNFLKTTHEPMRHFYFLFFTQHGMSLNLQF